MIDHYGEVCGLGAAFCWATGGISFSRIPIPAAAINLAKNVVACVGLVGTVAVLCVVRGTSAPPVDLVVLAWLVPSAFIGLVLGDTWHFRALQTIGPRRALVMETLGPPLGVLFGWLVLGELLGPYALLGVTITVLGIVVVILERSRPDERPAHGSGSAAAGALFAFLAAASQALGAAWSKRGILALEANGADDAALEASAVRLVVAVALGVAMTASGRRLGPWISALTGPGVLRRLVPTAIVASYVGIWLSMLSFRHAPIGVATTLSAMTPIVALPILAIALKQRISPRAVAGAVLAVAGVALLVMT